MAGATHPGDAVGAADPESTARDHIAVGARRLGKRFGIGRGDVWALREVSFEVGRGHTLAIVGENGSGKSTLLDVLMGTCRPSEGQVHVEQPTAALLELGAGFFSELSGRDNVVQMGLLAGLSKRKALENAAAVERFAELGEFFDRPIRSYSAGMAMRLGFALAVSIQAPVLLVDEVLAVGDGYFQRKCIEKLLELKRQGTTLVLASHDLHALRALGDRALWLRLGRVEGFGSPGEVIGRYEEHLRRRSAEGGLSPGRRGTGEVEILEVEITDASGRTGTQFRSGETLVVRVLFETHKPLDSPVMGVALFRDDGVYCYGPNTRFDGVLAGRYDGRYRLIAEFPGLPLLGGDYEASVAFYDADHAYAYAWDHRLYRFRIVADRPDHGLVALPHRFRVERAGA